MKKYMLFFLPAVVLLGVVIYVAAKARYPSSVTICSIPKAYNCVSQTEEDDYISVDIFVNTKKSFIGEQKNIVDAFISDEEGEHLDLTVEKIAAAEDNINIKHKSFSIYTFTFKINFYPVGDCQFHIAPAALSINYRYGTSVRVYIGSFSYYKHDAPYNEALSVNKLKGVVNEIAGGKSLAAIEIGLCNDSPDDMEIIAITPLNFNITISAPDIISGVKEYRPDAPLWELLGRPYDFTSEGADDFYYLLKTGEKVTFLLPLKYRVLLFLNKTGLKISFIVGGSSGELICDDFLFFDTKEIARKTLEDLVMYTYENH